jgi:hypothetical protein
MTCGYHSAADQLNRLEKAVSEKYLVTLEYGNHQN